MLTSSELKGGLTICSKMGSKKIVVKNSFWLELKAKPFILSNRLRSTFHIYSAESVNYIFLINQITLDTRRNVHFMIFNV